MDLFQFLKEYVEIRLEWLKIVEKNSKPALLYVERMFSTEPLEQKLKDARQKVIAEIKEQYDIGLEIIAREQAKLTHFENERKIGELDRTNLAQALDLAEISMLYLESKLTENSTYILFTERLVLDTLKSNRWNLDEAIVLYQVLRTGSDGRITTSLLNSLRSTIYSMARGFGDSYKVYELSLSQGDEELRKKSSDSLCGSVGYIKRGDGDIYSDKAMLKRLNQVYATAIEFKDEGTVEQLRIMYMDYAEKLGHKGATDELEALYLLAHNSKDSDLKSMLITPLITSCYYRAGSQMKSTNVKWSKLTKIYEFVYETDGEKNISKIRTNIIELSALSEPPAELYERAAHYKDQTLLDALPKQQ